MFSKEEHEGPPGIEERVAAGNHHGDRAGKRVQLRHLPLVRQRHSLRKEFLSHWTVCLRRRLISGMFAASKKRGRTGFDSLFEAQAACRGWFVGLVKIRTKTNKRRSPRSRSRGLIDRDVPGWTPATAGDMDSRLIVRRSDRAGR